MGFIMCMGVSQFHSLSKCTVYECTVYGYTGMIGTTVCLYSTVYPYSSRAVRASRNSIGGRGLVVSGRDALCYLWARHRIAMLADYNLLQPDDERIKEVTELGLEYNLLTNYTSFVAVDTEIRDKGGKSTTVKQPLPLPEGVSDYAVGGIAPASSPAPMLYRQKAAAAESYAGRGVVMNKAERKDSGAVVKIAEVTASGGLTKEAVRKIVEQRLKALKGCFPTQPSVKITIKLTIDASGAVKNVGISGIKDKAVQQCLRNIVSGWKFDPSTTSRNTEAAITIQIGS